MKQRDYINHSTMVPVILKPKQKKINEEKKKEKNPKTTEEKNVKK